MFSPLIDELIHSLCCLPGVGRKSAQRMALHLLERDPEGAKRLVAGLDTAIEKVGRCQQCRILTEQAVCFICSNTKRNQTLLCVVETPADVVAIEQSGTYQGKYFVLNGHLSPIDGIGPEELGLPDLFQRLQAAADTDNSARVEELILATNPTVEGEATAHYIADQARHCGINVSRIAHGVPLGGELEFIDGGTLTHAFSSRRAF
ncbi:MAG: recombination protein RecR [Kiritimatiellia bacterium]